jgi:predicted DNA-binding transcriptional regulator YafY
MLTVTFTQDELTAIAALLDAAVKSTGIQGAKAALPIIAKLEQAVAEANKPKDQSVENE